MWYKTYPVGLPELEGDEFDINTTGRRVEEHNPDSCRSSLGSITTQYSVLSTHVRCIFRYD